MSTKDTTTSRTPRSTPRTNEPSAPVETYEDALEAGYFGQQQDDGDYTLAGVIEAARPLSE